MGVRAVIVGIVVGVQVVGVIQKLVWLELFVLALERAVGVRSVSAVVRVGQGGVVSVLDHYKCPSCRVCKQNWHRWSCLCWRWSEL